MLITVLYTMYINVYLNRDVVGFIQSLYPSVQSPSEVLNNPLQEIIELLFVMHCTATIALIVSKQACE